MRLFHLVGAAVLSACAANADGPKSDSGQTGSIGPSADECMVDGDCEQRAAAEAAMFSLPSQSARHFGSAECTDVGVVGGPSGPSCVCHEAGSNGTLNVGPVGLDCYAYGRAGDCLWAGSEFEGCDVTHAASCDATCTELEQRLTDDAERSFEASSVYAVCQSQVCKTVIQIDGRCFADGSYTAGRAYECSLGGESILAAEQAAQRPPEQDEIVESRTPYVEGTDGMVQLTSGQTFYGTHAATPSFGAFAQFAVIHGTSVDYGESIDPLEGVDDCGVFKSSGQGAAADVSFYDAADVRLLDDGRALPLELSQASHDDFYSYILELDPLDVAPRYGGRYGMHVSGGTFGASFDVAEGLHLPQALTINELRANDHFEQQDLPLTWTGQGEAPLVLYLTVNKTLNGFFESTELRCLIDDDGEFTIPGSVLQAMPTGFASALFMREERRVVKSGAHSLLLWGSIQLSHQFALGPICDNTAALEACQASAESIRTAYEACQLAPPPLEQLCPEFISSSCDTCPEYFDCTAQQTQCSDQGLTTPLGCRCP